MLKEKISSLNWATIFKYSISFSGWIYILCGLNFLAFGQEFNPHFNRILPNDGLNNRFNEFIQKDSKGLVWISSTEGLYQFDGIKMKHFHDGENNGLLGNNIQSNFFEDKNSDVWFTTDRGINKYIREENRFDSYRLKDQKGGNLETGYKLFFIENDSILWLCANNNIYSFNPITKEQNHLIESEGVRFGTTTYPNGKLKLIVACPWINNSGVQLISFDENGLYKNNYLFKNGLPNRYGYPVETSKAIIENDSLIWLFSNEGILELNPHSPNKVRSYPLKGPSLDLLKDGVSLNDHYLLVNSKNSGLWVFNKKNKKFEKNFSIQDNSSISLSTMSLREIYLDNEEILWLSNHFEPAIDYTWIFNNKFTNPFDKITDVNPKVNSILEDLQSRIWCSTENNGVFVFQDDSLLHHYNFSKNEAEKGQTPEKLKQLSLDKVGRIWGISNHEIFYNHNEKWIKYHEVPFKIFCFINSKNSSLILSTNEGIIELKVDQNSSDIRNSWSIDKQSGFQISKLFPSAGKRFYASSNGNSILIFNLVNEQYKLMSEVKIGADIYDILEDNEENCIWISTSKGLWNLNIDSSLLRRKNLPAKTLNNASILSYFKNGTEYEIVISNGNIWVNEIHQNKTFRYQKEDGIKTDQFSLFASLIDSNGKIWLGTNIGLLCFNPTEIKPYPFPSKIYLKNLKVNNGPANNQLKVDELTELELNHNENSFELEVLGITNYHPELTQIIYNLENYNSEWKTIPNGGVLQFTKIPSGTYKLKIISNNANNIKSNIRELEITILLPWWSELWFITTFMVGISLLGFGIFRWFLKRKLAQQKLVYDALQNERNRIASEMHDDLGSGLYSIKILLQGVQDHSISSDVSEKVNKVEKKTTKLVENMREIIWAMDGGNDNFPDLIAYIRTFFLEFFDETSINAKAQIPTDMPNSIISGKERRSVFLCIKEAVHNIAKHSNADEAELLFKKTQRKFIIEVRDNGRGINLESSNKFGNGLENMKRRMENINGKCIINSTSGTSIILEIPIK